MTKRFLLSYNSITKEYYLDEGFFGEKYRINLGQSNSDDVIIEIKKTLEKHYKNPKEFYHRKTFIYTDSSIQEQTIKNLEILLQDTEIEIKKVDDLREI